MRQPLAGPVNDTIRWRDFVDYQRSFEVARVADEVLAVLTAELDEHGAAVAHRRPAPTPAAEAEMTGRMVPLPIEVRGVPDVDPFSSSCATSWPPGRTRRTLTRVATGPVADATRIAEPPRDTCRRSQADQGPSLR